MSTFRQDGLCPLAMVPNMTHACKARMLHALQGFLQHCIMPLTVLNLFMSALMAVRKDCAHLCFVTLRCQCCHLCCTRIAHALVLLCALQQLLSL